MRRRRTARTENHSRLVGSEIKVESSQRNLSGADHTLVVRTKQMTPVASSSVTPAKAGVQGPAPSTVSAALDTRFRGHDEEEHGCRALEAYR